MNGATTLISLAPVDFNFRFGGQPSPYIGAIGNIYTELESQGMTSAQAAQFIRDAITVYCPDQKGS